VPGVLEHENWFARINGRLYSFNAAVAAGSRVSLAGAVDTGPDPGPDVVHYMPPPFDVQTPAGGLAAAFNDFPISEEPPP